MVTREELRTKLWANDTFVDFDHGLNSAVQRLRDCLSDSGNGPRWIETIPRRGSWAEWIGRKGWEPRVLKQRTWSLRKFRESQSAQQHRPAEQRGESGWSLPPFWFSSRVVLP
jgi:hypothetical protein